MAKEERTDVDAFDITATTTKNTTVVFEKGVCFFFFLVVLRGIDTY